MVLVLQLCDKTFLDHAFLFETVNPFGPQFKGHYSYSHILYPKRNLILPLPVNLS